MSDMLTNHDLEAILQDPDRTREVVISAIRAYNTLITADHQGKTPDGDMAHMSARSTLHQTLVVDPRLVGLQERVAFPPVDPEVTHV